MVQRYKKRNWFSQPVNVQKGPVKEMMTNIDIQGKSSPQRCEEYYIPLGEAVCLTV